MRWFEFEPHLNLHIRFVLLISIGGPQKHSCTLKPLSIPNTTFVYFSKYMFEVKIKASVQRSEWNWRKFVSLQMSASWCNQLNEGVSKLTRRKSFLGKNFFVEMSVCTTRVICFTFILLRFEWNEIYSFLVKFTTNSVNTWKQNKETYKLSNIHDKKI